MPKLQCLQVTLKWGSCVCARPVAHMLADLLWGSSCGGGSGVARRCAARFAPAVQVLLLLLRQPTPTYLSPTLPAQQHRCC